MPYLGEHHIAHEEHLWSENEEQRDIRDDVRILLLVLGKLVAPSRKYHLLIVTIRWLLDQV